MKNSLNLMTDDDRRQQMLVEARRFWSRILLATIVLLSCVAAMEWWQGTATTAELARLEDRYAPVESLKQECIRMRTKINVMQDAQQLTLRLVDTHPTVTLLGAISAAASATDDGVYVEQLELNQPAHDDDARTAVVAGVGRDNTSIAKFTNALRSSQLFASVTLSSSDSSDRGNASARAFRIECQL